jgi:hypothetical protein
MHELMISSVVLYAGIRVLQLSSEPSANHQHYSSEDYHDRRDPCPANDTIPPCLSDHEPEHDLEPREIGRSGRQSSPPLCDDDALSDMMVHGKYYASDLEALGINCLGQQPTGPIEEALQFLNFPERGDPRDYDDYDDDDDGRYDLLPLDDFTLVSSSPDRDVDYDYSRERWGPTTATTALPGTEEGERRIGGLFDQSCDSFCLSSLSHHGHHDHDHDDEAEVVEEEEEIRMMQEMRNFWFPPCRP